MTEDSAPYMKELNIFLDVHLGIVMSNPDNTGPTATRGGKCNNGGLSQYCIYL